MFVVAQKVTLESFIFGGVFSGRTLFFDWEKAIFSNFNHYSKLQRAKEKFSDNPQHNILELCKILEKN